MSTSTDDDIETRREIIQVVIAAAFLVLFFLFWTFVK
jgi:hypothetical protein